jgi:hypothetical protein
MLILTLSKYNVLFDTCAKRVRGFPKSLRYDAEEKWKTMVEFHRPNPRDEEARANFFAAVNNACEMEINTPEK